MEALTEQFKDIVTSLGGKVGKVEYWGVKSLAYRIKKNRKAHFTLINLDAPPAAIAEMERQWSINEDILRSMTIRVDALEEGPSAMMRKRDDDDRGDRGDPRRPLPVTVADRGDRPTARRAVTTTRRRRTVLMTTAAAARRRLFPPPQDLPLLRAERAEDRLQGHASAVALHLRARQDRALAHHRRLGQEAARIGPGHQARPLPRPAALRDRLI